MGYTPTSDFLALFRTLSDGKVRSASMPGLDFVMAALSRAGLVTLWTNVATAPEFNQETTVWLKPSSTSYAGEGSVWLWNASTQTFEPATPDLWAAMFDAFRTTNNTIAPIESRALTPQESGSLFTNANAPIINFTLPPIETAGNAVYEFLQTAEFGVIGVLVDSHGNPDADVMRYGITLTRIGAVSGSTGSYLKVKAQDGSWWVIGAEGAWTLS